MNCNIIKRLVNSPPCRISLSSVVYYSLRPGFQGWECEILRAEYILWYMHRHSTGRDLSGDGSGSKGRCGASWQGWACDVTIPYQASKRVLLSTYIRYVCVMLALGTRLRFLRDNMSQKRTIEAFFSSAPKRPRVDIVEERSTPDGQDEIVRLHTLSYLIYKSRLWLLTNI
jgi:hypothetical protein